MIELVCGVMLVAGCWKATPWKDGRYFHYVFVFVAFQAFLALGPRAAWLTFAAGATGTLAHAAARGSFRRTMVASSAVPLSLSATTIATAVGIFATDAVARSMGTGYPVPFSTVGSVGRFSLLLTCLFATSAVAKEGLLRLLAREPDGASAARTESGASVYSVGAVVGAPLHYVAHPLFVRGLLLPWAAAMGWAFLLDAVLYRELERDRRAKALEAELARKERLSAVGEVTARIVHQTRHQLGVIGISAHRIGKRLGALRGEDAGIVREELAKLDEVQRELREMLTRDLRGGARPPEPTSPPSYAEVIASVTRRLASVAETRGVRLELGSLDLAAGCTPTHVEHVSQGLFNVIENALAAAREVVRVEARDAVAGPSGKREVVVSVVDDGPGLPPGVLERAMDPFFTTKPDGTGMGLAIARAAFDEEGAALRMSNRPEGGCQVVIALPATAPRDQAGRRGAEGC